MNREECKKQSMDLNILVEPLLTWYKKGHRQLPWRENKDPYRIWVSEIMLQQTRVEAVKPYFYRFMEKYPDISHLAMADDEELLKYWEGLGYYSRVRNLKKAAVTIVKEYNGRMPDEYSELIKLSGIGSYTAGAIASIAFNKPIPAVDGNVLRILSRVRADDASISDPKVKKRVEKELSLIMPGENSGDFNQAMMELGATVCLPNGQPKCDVCPWAKKCVARAQDAIADYPKKDAKKERKIEEKTILVLKKEEKLALRKRDKKGLLAGMYELPGLEGFLTEQEVLVKLKDMGMSALRIEKLEPAKHIFTHKEWHMIAYAIRIDELEETKSKDIFFVNPKETEKQYPIPSAFHAFVKYFDIKLGKDGIEERFLGGTV